LPLALEAATRASNVSRGHWFGEAIQPAIWARELKPSLLRMPRTMGNVNDTPPAMFEVFGVWGLLAIPVAGVAVAVAAALLLGRWAVRTSVIEVLHAE